MGGSLEGLKQALRLAGVSQSEAANAVGVGVRTLRSWIAGDIPRNAQDIIALHDFLEGRRVFRREKSGGVKLVPVELDDGRRARTWRAAAAEMLDDVEMLYEKARHAVALRLEAEATGDEPMVTEGAAGWIQPVEKKDPKEGLTGTGHEATIPDMARTGTSDMYPGEVAREAKVWLYPTQKERLRRLSETTGASISELLRQGVEVVLSRDEGQQT